MNFKDSKQYKLKEKPFLRIMHYAGMVSWKCASSGEAIQMLRLVHPLSWAWIVLVTVFSVFAQGIPETVRELKYVIKNETVWI